MTFNINQFFAAEDQLGTIRLKISSLIQNTEFSVEEIELFVYLDLVFRLNLVTSDSKTMALAEYVPGQQTLDMIENSIDGIVNIYVKAYFLDILQSNKRKKFVYAQQAILLYFDICSQRKSLSEKRDFLLRIIEVLKGLGKGNHSILLPIFTKVRDEVLAADIRTECISVTAIITAMIALKAEPVEYDVLISLVEASTAGFWAASEFKYYRQCNHALALLVPAKSAEYALEVARAYVAEADELRLLENASQHMVANLYKKAFRLYKNMGLNNEGVDALGFKLLEAQKQAVIQMSGNAMPPTQVTVNPHLQFPEFENVFQAVYWLISMPLPSKSRMQLELEQRQKGTLHQFFLGLSMADAKGYTIGNSPDSDKQIYLDAKLTRELYCKSVIIPMYDHFRDNFAIAEAELNGLLYHSKFIPPERLSIFTRGLYHGFCGNFVEAVYLLVPQIEHGLKTLLNNQGTITRKLNQDIQTEKNLQYFLDELEGTLSEDLLFELDGLLNEAFGENLRHDLAHGLCETHRLESWLGLHTWWLALKLTIGLKQLMVEKQP